MVTLTKQFKRRISGIRKASEFGCLDDNRHEERRERERDMEEAMDDAMMWLPHPMHWW
jgi:hypothetical protein